MQLAVLVTCLQVLPHSIELVLLPCCIAEFHYITCTSARCQTRSMTQLHHLSSRYAAIEARMSTAETSLTRSTASPPATPSEQHGALHQRYTAMHSRLAAIEWQLGLAAEPEPATAPNSSLSAAARSQEASVQAPPQTAAVPQPSPAASQSAAAPAAAAAMAAPHGAAAWRDSPPGATQQRLAAELDAKGVTRYSFLRVVGDYYDHSLEWRRECLGAPSVFHLCKSMVMENTRAVGAPVSPPLPRYFLVILQYAAAVHAEKLKKVLHRAANRGRPAGSTVGKQHFNPRLVPEELSDQLTGFRHNAVSPIALATPLPIIMSDRIAALQPPVFWLGGGEADLKVCLPVERFVEAYGATVVDCTDDKRTMAV